MRNMESASTEQSEESSQEQNHPPVESPQEIVPSMTPEQRQTIERRDAEELSHAREHLDRAFESRHTEPTVEQMNTDLRNNSHLQRGIKNFYKQFDEDLRQQKIWQQEQVTNSGLTVESRHDSSTLWGKTVNFLMGETPREREQRISYNATVLNGANEQKWENYQQGRKQNWFPGRKTLERLFYGNSEEGLLDKKIEQVQKVQAEKEKDPNYLPDTIYDKYESGRKNLESLMSHSDDAGREKIIEGWLPEIPPQRLGEVIGKFISKYEGSGKEYDKVSLGETVSMLVNTTIDRYVAEQRASGKKDAEIEPLTVNLDASGLTGGISMLGFRNREKCNLVVNGDCEAIGFGMKGGKVELNGNSEWNAAAQMEGGTLVINGNAGKGTGFEMKGGNLQINGAVEEMSADYNKPGFKGKVEFNNSQAEKIENDEKSINGEGKTPKEESAEPATKTESAEKERLEMETLEEKAKYDRDARLKLMELKQEKRRKEDREYLDNVSKRVDRDMKNAEERRMAREKHEMEMEERRQKLNKNPFNPF